MSGPLPLWPMALAREAVSALAARVAPGAAPPRSPPSHGAVPCPGDSDELDRWIEDLAASHGVEAEAISISYPRAATICRAAPVLVRIACPGAAPALLVLIGARRGRAELLKPDGTTAWHDQATLTAALTAALDESSATELEALLATLPGSSRQRQRMHVALSWQRHKLKETAVGWLLRPPPTAPLLADLRDIRMGRRVVLLLATRLAGYVAALAGWAALGYAALTGSFERALQDGWVLATLTLLPLSLAASWQAMTLAVDLGVLLKRKAMVGALALEVEPTRTQGIGSLLGQVLELQAIEALGVGNVLLALGAVLELVISMAVLALATGADTPLLALCALLGLTAGLARRAWVRRRVWADARMAMTHDLIERMLGQRTRLAQELATTWHDDEDRALSLYLDASLAADRALIAVRFVPRAWLVLGVATMASRLVGTDASSEAAVALGAVVMAYRALSVLTGALPRLLDAAISFRAIRPLLVSPSKDHPPPPRPILPGAPGELVLEARAMEFRHRVSARAVFTGLDLRLCAGERWLLLGPSGGGKSTLVALLTGLRTPSAGRLLLHGEPLTDWGREAWRRRAAAAPQPHENHILCGTVAFNVLVGRRWPASEADLRLANDLCRELGLGPLLDRMPSGMEQVLGETGWRISHGERSRIFLARALMQGAEVVVLDESLAALDPTTAGRCLEVALARAPTLVLVAHP